MRISDWSSDVCSSDLGVEEFVNISTKSCRPPLWQNSYGPAPSYTGSFDFDGASSCILSESDAVFELPFVCDCLFTKVRRNPGFRYASSSSRAVIRAGSNCQSRKACEKNLRKDTRDET